MQTDRVHIAMRHRWELAVRRYRDVQRIVLQAPLRRLVPVPHVPNADHSITAGSDDSEALGHHGRVEATRASSVWLDHVHHFLAGVIIPGLEPAVVRPD